MDKSLYSKRPNLIIGFHGCDQSVVDKVLTGKDNLIASKNHYDWLGRGIYFWENNEERALDWAIQLSKRENSFVKNPAVIGAVIDLGFCLDLTDNHFLNELKVGYNEVVRLCKSANKPIPNNKPLHNSIDLLLRNLDYAVIETIHWLHKKQNNIPYDSVRGVFWEGQDIYPNAGFKEKNHIQICICNPNCIKGYFLPRMIDERFTNP